MEHPFADQCLDLAKSILGNNLSSINEDGTIEPVEGEIAGPNDPGHAALAIGEFHRATGELAHDGVDIVDLSARVITRQAFTEEESENGLAYCALGLLSFGPSKERNPVWERLHDQTRDHLDSRLLARTDYEDHRQAFNVAKAVTRFSLGLSKKDETGKLIERFIERLQQTSSGGFVDAQPEGLGGVFDIQGVSTLVFIRQALQLHGNLHLRERKLPTLRTYAEKYIKLLPDLVRQDGLGWAFGDSAGAYGQMHCISILLQGLRDGWVSETDKPRYLDILRRLFQFFFVTYIDQETGSLVIRDHERTALDRQTTRRANFDAARYLCQWSRLARAIGGNLNQAKPIVPRTSGRYVAFDKSNKKEQGLFIYQDPQSGLHIQMPLISGAGRKTSDYFTFPHAPGLMESPVGQYLPLLVPELKFGDNVTVPCFYGKRCTTGLGMRNSFYFRYDQPELITVDEKIVSGLGSCKVNWTFAGSKITSEFIYTVNTPIQLDSMRYAITIGAPHSLYRLGTSFRLGDEGLRPVVIKDDFHAEWLENEDVSNDPAYRSPYGKIYYIQRLERKHPLQMKPHQQYRLVISFEPSVAFAED
jgi:hypothetical protein